MQFYARFIRQPETLKKNNIYAMKFQEKEKKEEKKKYYPSEEEKEGKECPNCGTINKLDARFCEECGYDFSGERHCPKCGAKVSPNADICETCGEWLLEGKCKFCYADIEEGATYCSECGNPVAGIVCPQCGKLSYFDFCKNCNIPLTSAAKKMTEDIKNDPKEQELLNLLESYIPEEVKEVSSEKEELLKMKAYIEKVNKKVKKKKTFTPLFSEKQKKNIKEIDKMADKEIKRQEEEKRRQEEERIRIEEEKRKKLEELLNQMQNRKFSSNQDARRYYSSHRPKNPRGWQCNFSGMIHDCPEECADPWQGGHWLI